MILMCRVKRHRSDDLLRRPLRAGISTQLSQERKKHLRLLPVPFVLRVQQRRFQNLRDLLLFWRGVQRWVVGVEEVRPDDIGACGIWVGREWAGWIGWGICGWRCWVCGWGCWRVWRRSGRVWRPGCGLAEREAVLSTIRSISCNLAFAYHITIRGISFWREDDGTLTPRVATAHGRGA